MLCAVMCARATGAHTPAAITHNHSSSTPVMVLREHVNMGIRGMLCILGTHTPTCLYVFKEFEPNQPLSLIAQALLAPFLG